MNDARTPECKALSERLEEERKRAVRREWWAALVLVGVTVLWWAFVPDGFAEKRLQSLVPYVLALFLLLQWGWSWDVGKVLRGLVEWEGEAKRERERILAEFKRLNDRLDKLERSGRLTTSERSEMEVFPEGR